MTDCIQRDEVCKGYHPDGWRVYVIEDAVLGFFAGYTNKGAPKDVPIFCATLNGAQKYDAFRDLSARERAVAIRDRYAPDATVWAYRRHEIFPERYRRAGA